MSAPLVLALFFTVAFLAVTTYFLMSSVPLLILKHDTPMDSRFVRAFFDIYYRAATFTASATAVSYVLAGRPGFAAGGAVLALLATLLRRLVVPRMDSLRVEMKDNAPAVVQADRSSRGRPEACLTAFAPPLVSSVRPQE